MTDKNLTEIVVVLDRSGSMASIQDDMVGGLNSFIKEQKEAEGEANFTLIQFDTQYEVVHDGVPINTVEKCTMNPRGGTALLDAMGRAIVDTGRRLNKIPEHDRPGLVKFIIITDGEENASKDYTSDQIKSMVEEQSNVYSWVFTYLGANQDAFAVSQSMGIKSYLKYNTENTMQMFAAASSNVTRSRSSTRQGLEARNLYTEDEINSVK